MNLLTTVASELKQSTRSLLRRRLLAGTCVLVVALAIGTNCLLFSIVHGVLFLPPPYPHHERIVTIDQRKRADSSLRRGFAEEAARDVIDNTNSLSEVVLMRSRSRALDASGRLHRLNTVMAHGDLLSLFGYQPVLGRGFRADEAGSVMLAHHVWLEYFSGDRNVLGQAIRLDGEVRTVVGVLPADFKLPFRSRFDLLEPYPFSNERFGRPFFDSFHLYGRLKDGVAISHLQSELDALAERLRADLREEDRDRFFRVVPIAEDQIVPEVRQHLLILQAAGLLVLLLCVTNAANLVLSISGARVREVAIRQSLGITRGRLFTHLFLEVSLLVFVGTLLGILLAFAGLSPVLSSLPQRVATSDQIRFSAPVLVSTVTLGALIALVCTLPPFLRSRRLEFVAVLKGSRTTSEPRGISWMKLGFLSVQLALAVVICMGAGLMLQTLRELRKVDLGANTEDLYVASMSLPSYLYGLENPGQPIYQRILESVSALPGVEAAAITNYYPGQYGGLFYSYATEDTNPDSETSARVRINPISSGLAAVLGLSLIEGRFIQPGDTAEAPRVVVMNESFAREAFAESNPVGQRIQLLRDWYTVCGVVRDYHNNGLRNEKQPEAFVSFFQEFRGWGNLLVRTGRDPASQKLSIERAIELASREVFLDRVESVHHLLEASIGSDTHSLTESLTFLAVMALMISVAGTFGLSAHWVRSRTREIGIRQALGATAWQVVQLVVSRGVRWALGGVALGIGLALLLGRFLESYVFGVSPNSPWLLAAVTAGLLLLVAGSSLIPARWAAGIDPAVTLRSE